MNVGVFYAVKSIAMEKMSDFPTFQGVHPAEHLGGGALQARRGNRGRRSDILIAVWALVFNVFIIAGRIGLVIVVCGMLGSMLSGIILDKSVLMMMMMMMMLVMIMMIMVIGLW